MARTSAGGIQPSEIQDAIHTYAEDAEASDSYAITLDPAPSAYTAGQMFVFKANTANTGAASLNVNSLGAVTIKKRTGTDLANNDIQSGSIVSVVYDGTNFQMISMLANAPAGSGDMVAATYDPAAITEQLVGLTATQTLTNKTLTTPTLTLKQSTAPTPTAEGDIQWDTDNNQIKIGDGASTLVFTDDANLSITESQISDLGSYITDVVSDTTPQLGGSLDVNGQKIVSVSNGNIDIEPNGTGNVLIGNFTFDADQTVGAGQDNYVLTYDNGTGLISLEASVGGGGGGITWNEVTGTTQAAAVDNGYLTNNAGAVTVTLPATASVGETVRVAGSGAGGWVVAQNAGQTIHFGNVDSTTGAGGSLASTNRYDAVEMVCITANTDWVVASSMGNITIV